MREARLELTLANLVISGVALQAMAATCDERNSDAITDLPLRDLLSDFCYYSRKFMPWHMGQDDVWIVALPAMPIAATYSCRHYLDHNSTWIERRIGNI